MSKTLLDYELIPDCNLGDDDEFPGENEMITDIEAAMQDFADYADGNRSLRTTVIPIQEVEDQFCAVAESVTPSGLHVRYTGQSRNLSFVAA
jgi:hypothetical protein